VPQISPLLDRACAARESWIEPRHESAFRLFNGFLEGWPDLVIDIYATTAVFHDHVDTPGAGNQSVIEAVEFIRRELPWVKAGVVKTRNSASENDRRGRLLFGESTDKKIREHGVWYALDLFLNQDTSLYLDTRNLRQWALTNLRGKSVLNTFAYTGSLGVAAMAGGASRAVHVDLDRRFLNLARTSCTLNGFPVQKADFITGEFFAVVSQMKRAGERFDCVFLDPPFFSTTPRSRLDLNTDSARLINKVRPLINDGGWLVTVNNSLYVSGRQYLSALEALCADGYLSIEALIPVPEDFTGFPETRKGEPVTDPDPFNHSTKIAILKVRRKDKADTSTFEHNQQETVTGKE
jgi:23S rRNA (cytosine1962-C5)-methyltransferase